ncbi:tetratricopeptide repeat protein [Chrysiogenes arsenatis]|uniref:tetratricopeptide repeat protein n=1 Tax=Chrysiogenes arsenatis TaxID=309797 RepID=UPI0004055269|nr:hypothetical protein [Chrysiogenes arsenatis]
MYTILIMLTLWMAFGAGLSFFMPIWASTIVGVLLTAAIMYFAGKKLFGVISRSFQESQKALQKGNFARSIRILDDARRYKPWQFQLEKQIDSQIGTIYYLQKEYAKAKEYLARGMDKHWVGITMLGVIYYRDKEFGAMEHVMDRAVKKNAKQPVVWGLYAWLMEQTGNRDKALQLLQQGYKKNPTADALEQNIVAMQNGKKIKMRLFGEQWYQYMLEMPATQSMSRFQKGFHGRPSAAQVRAAQRMQAKKTEKKSE